MKKDINAKDQEKSQELTPSAAEASAEAVKKGKRRKRSVLAFVVAAFVISTVVTLISCWSVSMAGKMHEIRSDSSDKAKTVAQGCFWRRLLLMNLQNATILRFLKSVRQCFRHSVTALTSSIFISYPLMSKKAISPTFLWSHLIRQ